MIIKIIKGKHLISSFFISLEESIVAHASKKRIIQIKWQEKVNSDVENKLKPRTFKYWVKFKLTKIWIKIAEVVTLQNWKKKFLCSPIIALQRTLILKTHIRRQRSLHNSYLQARVITASYMRSTKCASKISL